jgi:ferredoxin
MDETLAFATIAGLGLVALVSVPLALRRRRQARDERALARNVALGLDVPASIHPVIDTDRCIGSLSCLKACPEGDILGIVGGAARLVHAGNCMGHGRCAASCPVGAITLVSGTAVRGVDLPEVDGRYQSSRAGLHLIGELAGIGLLENAVEQGVQCAGFVAEALRGGPGGDPGRADAVVIGASPAGVGCAVTLRALGRSVRLLDPEGPGSAAAAPRRRLEPLAGPLELPWAGRLRARRVGNEQVDGWLERALAGAGLRVEGGLRVTSLSGQDGAFTVETVAGPIAARKVVLATAVGGAPGGEGEARDLFHLAFLARMGVDLRRDPGQAKGPPEPGLAPSEEDRQRRRWRRALALVGGLALVAMAWLTWSGRGYYLLSPAGRHDSPLHLALRPAAPLGLTIGIAATAVMLTNFLYALRKRWRVLDGVGPLGRWLDLHVFVGIMSPLVIAFHAAFQANNLMAGGTYWALAVVVATGLVGRYLYGLVPGAGAAAVELADLLGQVERTKDRLQPLLAGAVTSAALEPLFAEASARSPPRPLPVRILRSLPEALRFRLRLVIGLRRLPPGDRAEVRDGLVRLRRLRLQADLFDGIRRLMRTWRSLHVSMAILLVVALASHIGVAIYLGYGPRLR